MGCQLCSFNCEDIFYYEDIKKAKDKNIMIVFQNLNKYDKESGGLSDIDKSLLFEMLNFYGIPREKVYITSLVKHYVEDKKMKQVYVKGCRKYLIEEIELIKPKLIIGLGKEPAKLLSGKNKSFDFMRGYTFYNDTKDFFNINTYEPKNILKYYPFFTDFKNDFIKIKNLYNEILKNDRDYIIDKFIKLVKNINFKVVNTIEGLKELEYLINSNTLLTFDIETSGLKKGDSVLKVGLGDVEKELYYIIHENVITNPESHKIIGDILYTNRLITQNGKFDIRFISQASNISLDINRLYNYFDTMIAHIMLDSRVGTHGLKKWAKEYFNAPDWEEDIKKYLPNKDSSYSLIPSDVLDTYLSYDLYYTTKGYKLFNDLLDVEETRSYFNILMQAVNVFTEIEYHGISVASNIETVKRELEEKQENALTKLVKLVYDYGFTPENYAKSTGAKTLPLMGAFNPNSPKQAQYAFYTMINEKESIGDEQKIDLYEVSEGEFKASCCKGAVEQYRHKHYLWEALSEYKNYGDTSFMKALSLKMDNDSRIRTSFLLAVATGRMSSQGFNIQNLKRGSKIKNLLLPDEDCFLVDIDYCTLEVVIAGCLSKDPEILKVFYDGGDFHSITTENIFSTQLKKYRSLSVDKIIDEVKKDSMLAESRNKILEQSEKDTLNKAIFKAYRQKSKSVTFGVLYKRGAQALAKNELNCSTSEAQQFIDNFNTKYKVFKAWSDSREEFSLSNGYITTFFGHKRRFPFIYEGNEHQIRRQSANTDIQGTSSQITLTSILRIHDRFKKETPRSRIMFTVHDSIVGSIHKSEAYKAISIMIEEMTKNPIIPELNLGVEVEIGMNYGEKDILLIGDNEMYTEDRKIVIT